MNHFNSTLTPIVLTYYMTLSVSSQLIHHTNWLTSHQ